MLKSIKTIGMMRVRCTNFGRKRKKQNDLLIFVLPKIKHTPNYILCVVWLPNSALFESSMPYTLYECECEKKQTFSVFWPQAISQQTDKLYHFHVQKCENDVHFLEFASNDLLFRLSDINPKIIKNGTESLRWFPFHLGIFGESVQQNAPEKPVCIFGKWSQAAEKVKL